jgi:hypothetical protein
MSSSLESPTPDPEASSDDAPLKQSRLISKVLAPALRLWLRSQVEHVEELQVTIEAGDRQIMSGHIQQVMLSAEQAVYQGLSLSQIRLIGQNIRVNLGQVVRGKPLRLLEPIAVQGSVLFQETDLNASLNAPLLKTGITEFLVTFLKAGNPELANESLNLQNLQINLEESQVVIAAALVSVNGTETPIAIRTSFEMAAPNLLKLVNPQWLPHAKAKRGLAIDDLDGYTFDLGSETEIQELSLMVGQVTCQGRLMVRP